VKSNEDQRALLIFGFTMRLLVEIEDKMSGCEVMVKMRFKAKGKEDVMEMLKW